MEWVCGRCGKHSCLQCLNEEVYVLSVALGVEMGSVTSRLPNSLVQFTLIELYDLPQPPRNFVSHNFWLVKHSEMSSFWNTNKL